MFDYKKVGYTMSEMQAYAIAKNIKENQIVIVGTGLPLIGAWLVRNAIATGNASNRQILSHWVTMDDLRHGIVIFWRWIWPGRYGAIETPAPWMIWATAAFLGFAVLFCLIFMIYSVLLILWIQTVRARLLPSKARTRLIATAIFMPDFFCSSS